MPNFREGFKILANELDVQYHNTLDGNFERFTYYADDEKQNFTNTFTLNEEQSSILNECLENCNDVDSMDKIIEEFKELDWIKDENNQVLGLTFKKKGHEFTELVINKDFALKKVWIKEERENNNWALEDRPLPFNIKEIQLVNRIYRLWGVEV